MRDLTQRQKEVALFLRQFIRKNNYSPSIRDVAENFSFSVKAAYDHLQALETKKIIRTTDGLSRSIEIIGEEYFPHEKMISIPVLGTIVAGLPLMSEENTEYLLNLPISMIHNTHNTYFALKIRDESMIEAGIFDGDIAILRKCETANTGDIIAASVGEEEPDITLKGYYPSNGNIELRPANSALGSIITRECRIHGKLHLLIRNYA